jgi:tRNA pseudouridine32 synthase/23S rRNA pseudouridine746 synthase
MKDDGEKPPMNRSPFPSQTVVPETGHSFKAVIDFLEHRFPRIGRPAWEQRMKNGFVRDENDKPIPINTPCTPGMRIFYFREVDHEIPIPFEERIVHGDENLLVVSKPHFLPVIPSGAHVNECLLNRLKKATGNRDLTPIHRIDRETAGLVVFSINSRTRGAYQNLFMEGRIRKTYEAVTHCASQPPMEPLIVENRIVKGDPFFRMKTEPGIPNSRSRIECTGFNGRHARFRIEPETGKKHQIRLHLSGLGFGIVNDRYYPDLLPEQPPDFEKPLQLLARSLSFTDPVTDEPMFFECGRTLVFP